MRLVCLEAQKGEINWTQPLANVRDRLLLDVGRRMRGVNLAYGGGMLVCPTNAGAVLGVDLLTHSLVWAHSYREEQPNQEMPMMRRGMPWNGYMINHNLNSDWKASAPVIQDGKVVFTAPDGDAVYCLNLRDGTQLWKESRGEDVYLAGVYSGKVVLVGRNYCRALHLEDGKPLWRVETGTPSGQGVASNGTYYLPLKAGIPSKEPEVCAINLSKGTVESRTKSRKKEVPGNLIFYDGDVLSQTVLAVSAYPQLSVRLAQIDQALQKNPNDPVGMTDRGELKLDKGDLKGAVEDLRTALSNKPPPDVLPRTRQAIRKSYRFVPGRFRRQREISERIQGPVPGADSAGRHGGRPAKARRGAAAPGGELPLLTRQRTRAAGPAGRRLSRLSRLRLAIGEPGTGEPPGRPGGKGPPGCLGAGPHRRHGRAGQRPGTEAARKGDRAAVGKSSLEQGSRGATALRPAFWLVVQGRQRSSTSPGRATH